jgi:outer membrane lipoprotein carrier protein
MRTVQLTPAVASVCVLALAVAAQGQARLSADGLARDLQNKYDTVRDFSADFVHIYQGGILRQKATERGRLLIKKPGKMRWEYTSPEAKLFVSDGHRLYSYIPQDNQVLVTAVPADDQATTPALFLSGKGNLIRDFTVSFDTIPEAPAGAVTIKLIPRQPEPEYDWLSLAVDPKTLRILALATADAQGGRSTFTFANLRENVGLADNEFVFRMPRGIDVVTDAPAR